MRAISGTTIGIIVTFLSTELLTLAYADDVRSVLLDRNGVQESVKTPGYSTYAGRNFPTMVLWGDTHLHTDLSLDARAFGVTLGPDEAYQLARGDEVTTSHGERIRLSRPLDWLVISDHSDAMGTMKEIVAGNPTLLRDPTVQDWHNRINQGGETALFATMEIIETFAGITGESIPEILMDDDFVGSVWDEYLEVAEAYNDPGRFSAIIGYEWTSTEGGNNLHRNVLYRNGAEHARQMLPYTTAESFNPEDLWNWMAEYEQKTGGELLALAHNGNLSNGLMQAPSGSVGQPLEEVLAGQ